jgi:hypothetical protein
MQATLRALLGRTPSLPTLAEQSSALLYASTAPERHVTAAMVELDTATGAVRYVGAGHVDTLILRAWAGYSTCFARPPPSRRQ